MLKRVSIRKILITTSALFVIGLLYLFPSKEVKVKESVNYIDEEDLSVVYLLDSNSYVSEVNVKVSGNTIIEKLKAKLYIMTSKDGADDIPKSFKGIIPKNTTIKDLTINDNTVTVDFSKELLSVSSLLEEKMMEAIVYVLTSEENIEKVIVKVEGNLLERLPNSNKLLPEVLDRSYGINKDYDINSIYDLTKTTIYYNGLSDDINYYVPVTKIDNSKEEKVTIIVNELKSSILYQSNLSSYLNNNVKLESYNKDGYVMNLTFNDKIFDSIYNNILEEVVYTISMSVIDSYSDVSKVVFYVSDNEVFNFEV